MLIALLLTFGQSRISVDLRIEKPWTMCVPVLLVEPASPKFTFHHRTDFERVWFRGTCERPCVRWAMTCPEGVIEEVPSHGIVCEEWRFFPLQPLFTNFIAGSHPVTCELSWEPCPQGDVTGDCEVDLEDVKTLAASDAWNRLQVFQYVQEDWR